MFSLEAGRRERGREREIPSSVSLPKVESDWIQEPGSHGLHVGFLSVIQIFELSSTASWKLNQEARVKVENPGLDPIGVSRGDMPHVIQTTVPQCLP